MADGLSHAASSNDEQGKHNDQQYANQHIGSFLALTCSQEMKKIKDGSQLTASYLEQGDPATPFLVEDTPQSIGMKVPKNFTIAKVAKVIGEHYPVSVIDVQHQEELEGWTMGDLVDYFQDEDRLAKLSRTSSPSPAMNRRRRRAATQHSLIQTPPKVLNQISLEFSQTALAKMVTSPQFVRDLDWIDHAWPRPSDRPFVQYYCLTSTAGCYTDFHVDFGGTSVWYHVLQGQKEFILIPPTKQNLATYEDWLCRKNQADLFLPELIQEKEGMRKVTLRQSQTLYIPAGWIHAVYTPVDSLVFGGNFLHGLDISTQMDIHCLETRTRVPGKFRFPKYLALMMYTGKMYTKRLRAGRVCKLELEGLKELTLNLKMWAQVPSDQNMVQAMREIDEKRVLQDLEAELERIEKDGEIRPHPDYKGEPKKLRLKLTDTTAVQQPKKVKNSGPSFRITLPSSAKSTMPANRKSDKPKEDLTSFSGRKNNESDDEWVPGGPILTLEPKISSARAKRAKPAAKKPTLKKAPPPKASKVRQRLFRKLR